MLNTFATISMPSCACPAMFRTPPYQQNSRKWQTSFAYFVSVADVTGLVSDLKRDDFRFVPSALASNPENVKSFKGPGRVSAHHRIGDHYQ